MDFKYYQGLSPRSSRRHRERSSRRSDDGRLFQDLQIHNSLPPPASTCPSNPGVRPPACADYGERRDCKSSLKRTQSSVPNTCEYSCAPATWQDVRRATPNRGLGNIPGTLCHQISTTRTSPAYAGHATVQAPSPPNLAVRVGWTFVDDLGKECGSKRIVPSQTKPELAGMEGAELGHCKTNMRQGVAFAGSSRQDNDYQRATSLPQVAGPAVAQLAIPVTSCVRVPAPVPASIPKIVSTPTPAPSHDPAHASTYANEKEPAAVLAPGHETANPTPTEHGSARRSSSRRRRPSQRKWQAESGLLTEVVKDQGFVCTSRRSASDIVGNGADITFASGFGSQSSAMWRSNRPASTLMRTSSVQVQKSWLNQVKESKHSSDALQTLSPQSPAIWLDECETLEKKLELLSLQRSICAAKCQAFLDYIEGAKVPDMKQQKSRPRRTTSNVTPDMCAWV